MKYRLHELPRDGVAFAYVVGQPIVAVTQPIAGDLYMVVVGDQPVAGPCDWPTACTVMHYHSMRLATEALQRGTPPPKKELAPWQPPNT